MMPVIRSIHTLDMSPDEQVLAEKLLRQLESEEFRFEDLARLLEDSELADLLITILRASSRQLAEGHKLAILGLEQELSSQAAADLLGVSRQHLVSLMDSGELAHRKVGKHRRITLSDVLRFARETQRRREVASALVEEAQALGMGYE
ncbi:MAG: helix-turn-helix domain-containing protein [Trueperaceae bacterium]|nr:MAG: helix-turn-helix domain-containing protein [Trueperaceae bacterium]